MKSLLTGGLAWSLLLVGSSRADVIQYAVAGTPVVITLQGQATANPGGTITYVHPRMGKLIFAIQEVKLIQAPTPQSLFQRQLRSAITKKDANQVMQAARWGLKHGMLTQFYAAAANALEIDPGHQDALRIQTLREQLAKPLPPPEAEELHLRQLVRKPDMKVATSAHFVMLYDTPVNSKGRGKKPIHEQRLELLELVYESFLMKFYSQGVPLEIPQERLMTVLFAEHSDYLQFSTALSPELSSTAGFYDPTSNISVFFDQHSSEMSQMLEKLAEAFEKEKEAALRNKSPLTKHIVRRANTFGLIIDIAQENSGIEVVSHEAAHQMAGNTGLLPRHVRIPAWVHEGLATYFEAPQDAVWSGMGAVNKQRLMWYKALARDRDHSNIDFIAGDQIFSFARSNRAKLHGYAQAWALTHFLMEEHFDKFMTYYRRLGEMPPDVILSQAVLSQLFDECFGKDRGGLDAQWRSYMNSLKTDMQKLLDENK